MAVMDMLEEGEVKAEKVDGGTMVFFIFFLLPLFRPFRLLLLESSLLSPFRSLNIIARHT